MRDFAHGLAGLELAEQEFRESDDGGEFVVDFVGDPADEGVEQGGFLLLDQTMLQNALFGDVIEQGAHLAGFADPTGEEFETARASSGQVQQEFAVAWIRFAGIGFVFLQEAQETLAFGGADQF